SAYTLSLSDTGITFQHAGAVLRLNLPRTAVAAEERLPGVSNYYLGNQASAWRTNLPQYARIRYRSVFPGVDLTIYEKDGSIEYDWIIAPGADPSRIHYEFS